MQEKSTNHDIKVISLKTKGFTQYVNQTHYEHTEEINAFFKTCIAVEEKYSRYSRSASQDAANSFQKNELLTLQAMAAKLPELAELTNEAFKSYNDFMRIFSRYRQPSPTNKQIDYSGYKLHISLSTESYKNCRKMLRKILIDVITDGTIKHFKCTNSQEIFSTLHRSKKKLAQLNIYPGTIIQLSNGEYDSVENMQSKLNEIIACDLMYPHENV